MSPAGFPHSDILGSQLGCQLLEAYRRLLRPSSAPGAKASTVCPYKLATYNHTTSTDPPPPSRIPKDPTSSETSTSGPNSVPRTTHPPLTHAPTSNTGCTSTRDHEPMTLMSMFHP